MIECLQEAELETCSACEFYNDETGECDATPKQIRTINRKYTES